MKIFIFVLFSTKGRVAVPNQMNFRKSSKGNFKLGFLIDSKSNFRVQGMLFSTLYCITIVHLYNKIVQLYCITSISIYCTLVQHNCTTVLYYAYIWKSCACIPYYPAIITPCIYATISVIKICHIFSKNEGGGSKAVWIFSKNSSHSVAGPFP